MMKECPGELVLILTRVYEALELVQIFHRNRYSWLGDFQCGTIARCWCDYEDMVYLFNRVLCQDKVNGHIGWW